MFKEPKGIFVTVSFWTTFLKEDGTRRIIPKQAWAAGTLYVRASETHGIKAGRTVPFNNLEEFLVKIDEVLKENEVTLVMQDEKGDLLPRLGKGYPKWTWSG